MHLPIEDSCVCIATATVPFWPTLWPALVATILGVVIGLPIALWLSRLTQREAGRREERDRLAAVARVLQALRESVTWNGEKASRIAEVVQRGSLQLDVPLETERWEAIRPEFVRVTRDPELQGRVAFFFDQVRRTAMLADRRFAFTSGTSSTLANATQVASAVTTQLISDLRAISYEAEALSKELQRLELAASTAANGAAVA